ncbi:MAG: excinuclease ABC subunit UvrC [Clostridia bacterium]|nr:excinuclease ABC subunit UvrC [Clostridia bacterium]
MNDRRGYLLSKANELPYSPGVYIIRDKNEKIIYIGKSKALKNRVCQYFGEGNGHNIKTAKMVSNAYDFDYIVCATEMEALTLENQLIKLHTPKYNILLKDDKTYPYIRLSLNEDYPSLSVCRHRKNDRAKYYGPYSGTSRINSVIRTLQKVFLLAHCNHSFPRDIGKVRPCLYYRMGQCMGPCTGGVTSEQYKKSFSVVDKILRGSFSDVEKELEAQMLSASENLQFEEAAVIRDRISALKVLWEKQKVEVSPKLDADVISLYQNDKCSAISLLKVRCGCIYDSRNYIFSSDEIIDEDTFPSFVINIYSSGDDIGKNILSNVPMSDGDKILLGDYFCEKFGTKITVSVPQRGDGRALCDMAYENARQKAGDYIKNAEKDNAVLIKLASMLRLEVLPENIEAYDISNFGNDNITGGMITVTNGKFNKSKYRIFNIDSEYGQDDYGAMRKTLSRRLSHISRVSDGISELPDLWLIDGGKNHVAVAKEVLAEYGCDIPVFGMVKDDFHKTRALCTENEEISIAREQSVFMLIYRIQEEVHRFSVSKMSRAKSKSISTSALTEIEGVGKAKAATLLKHFKTLQRLKEAEVCDIEKVAGFSKALAQKTYDFLHSETNSNGDGSKL